MNITQLIIIIFGLIFISLFFQVKHARKKIIRQSKYNAIDRSKIIIAI
jgi:hypothetical protein